MSNFLDASSIQQWLESCPQGYLVDTEYGHPPGAREPGLLLENPTLREESISTTVQLVMGERAALAASSGLINAAPDPASKRFLATQPLDEARHVEIFTQRLYDLGVEKSELEETRRLTQQAASESGAPPRPGSGTARICRARIPPRWKPSSQTPS